MALQGTLDTFALPDVLRLLASTQKTGRLNLTGARGNGSVWVDGGAVAQAEASNARHASTIADVVFELLRYADGSFTFEAGAAAPSAGKPESVDSVLHEAEQLLVEWRSIEAVIPSMDSWISLSERLPTDHVVIQAEQWRSIVAVGGGCTVASLGDALAMGDVAVCRGLKTLVETGLLTVSASAQPAVTSTTDQILGAFNIDLEPTADVFASAGNGNGNGAGSILGSSINAGPAPAIHEEPAPEPSPLLPPAVFADATPDEADEVARQLANLSPQAARAVAAAAQASTDEERDAALAEVEEEEPINRGLLLKFLSSVRN